MRVPRADDAEAIAALFGESRALDSPALLLHSFRELRRTGAAVGLSVDSENPTGAVRLYESVGMRPVSRRVLYEKRLSGASAL